MHRWMGAAHGPRPTRDRALAIGYLAVGVNRSRGGDKRKCHQSVTLTRSSVAIAELTRGGPIGTPMLFGFADPLFALRFCHWIAFGCHFLTLSTRVTFLTHLSRCLHVNMYIGFVKGFLQDYFAANRKHVYIQGLRARNLLRKIAQDNLYKICPVFRRQSYEPGSGVCRIGE